ncbi:hypothetical protein KCTC52924_03724 [Arenibacter antarcticus]|uniref:Outer membrane protein beta-barrel domain-containing protein n=1 Tax=Arenibacter antarcticus TaxID=2040469 RepID=A0ABW5VDM3_9FLAO|nr:hypothetical protein [Arenibacter sp. H213]MCM4168166.1 hypothetical protein [Arenibacter sp. H213]
MKIVKLFALLLCCSWYSVSAQEISDHSIGLRLGDSDGFGAEISYQKSLFQYNRLEANLGWRDSRYFDAFKLSGLYQWIFPIDDNFNWYYGAGGGLGSVDFASVPDNNNNQRTPDGGLFIFAAGDIGVEYNFDFPLLLSLDFRPEIGLVGYKNFSNNFDFDIALGVRYQF